MDFKSKKVLITGASRGLGAEIARKLAKKGAFVILTSEEQTADELKKNTEEIQADGGDAEFHVMDVTNQEMIEKVYEKVKADHGTLDVLINNAGVLSNKCFHNGSLEDFEFMHDVNVKGYMRVAWAFMPILGRVPEGQEETPENKEGQIICVCSMSGEICVPLMQFYSITKAACRMVAKALREHYIYLNQPKMNVLEINPMQFESNLYSNDEHANKFAETMKEKGMMPTTEEIADQIIKAAEKEKQEIFIPALAQVTEYLYRLFPKLTTTLVRKQLTD